MDDDNNGQQWLTLQDVDIPKLYTGCLIMITCTNILMCGLLIVIYCVMLKITDSNKIN